MTTGPEHYRLAGAAIAQSHSTAIDDTVRRFWLDCANTHTQLADIAARVESDIDVRVEEWRRVLGLVAAQRDIPRPAPAELLVTCDLPVGVHGMTCKLPLGHEPAIVCPGVPAIPFERDRLTGPMPARVPPYLPAPAGPGSQADADLGTVPR